MCLYVCAFVGVSVMSYPPALHSCEVASVCHRKQGPTFFVPKPRSSCDAAPAERTEAHWATDERLCTLHIGREAALSVTWRLFGLVLFDMHGLTCSNLCASANQKSIPHHVYRILCNRKTNPPFSSQILVLFVEPVHSHSWQSHAN